LIHRTAPAGGQSARPGGVIALATRNSRLSGIVGCDDEVDEGPGQLVGGGESMRCGSGSGIIQEARCGGCHFLQRCEVLQQMLKDCPELLDVAAVDLVEQVRPNAFDVVTYDAGRLKGTIEAGVSPSSRLPRSDGRVISGHRMPSRGVSQDREPGHSALTFSRIWAKLEKASD
jgi:hypothetical protein